MTVRVAYDDALRDADVVADRDALVDGEEAVVPDVAVAADAQLRADLGIDPSRTSKLEKEQSFPMTMRA